MRRHLSLVTRLLVVAAGSFIAATTADAAVTAAMLRADYDAATHSNGVSSDAANIADTLGTGEWRFYASVTEDPTDAGANLTDLVFTTSANATRAANSYVFTAESSTFDLPGISNNKLITDDTGTITDGEMALHPGNAGDSSNRDYLVVRWTAGTGATGLMNVSGTIVDLESPPHAGINGLTFAVFDDSGTTLLGSTVVNTTQTVFDIDTTVAAAGDDIWFVAGNNGNWTWDMAALSITIVTPEPSRAMLLLLGFGGIVLRRRR